MLSVKPSKKAGDAQSIDSGSSFVEEGGAAVGVRGTQPMGGGWRAPQRHTQGRNNPTPRKTKPTRFANIWSELHFGPVYSPPPSVKPGNTPLPNTRARTHTLSLPGTVRSLALTLPVLPGVLL